MVEGIDAFLMHICLKNILLPEILVFFLVDGGCIRNANIGDFRFNCLSYDGMF